MIDFYEHSKEIREHCARRSCEINSVMPVIKMFYNSIEIMEFTEDFIDECKQIKSYLFKNKNGKSLINYLLDNNNYKDVVNILNNNKFININYFDGNELINLCKHKIVKIICNTQKLEKEYFINRLGSQLLNKNNIFDTITKRDKWKLNDFMVNLKPLGNSHIFNHIIIIEDSKKIISDVSLITSETLNTKAYNLINNIYIKTEMFPLLYMRNYKDILSNIKGITIPQLTKTYENGKTGFYMLYDLGLFDKIIQIFGTKINNYINNYIGTYYKSDKPMTVFDLLIINSYYNILNKIDNIERKHLLCKIIEPYEQNELTRLHMICQNSIPVPIELFMGLGIEDFQISDYVGNTALHYLCKQKRFDIIENIKGLQIKNLQNKNNNKYTELHYLCMSNQIRSVDVCEYIEEDNFYGSEHRDLDSYYTDRIQKILMGLKGLKIKHFQNINCYGTTELHYLCEVGMLEIILNISGLKIEHFQNKNIKNTTELMYLCIGNRTLDIYKILKIIKNNSYLKAGHFMNKTEMFYSLDGYDTELKGICGRKMVNVINLIDGLNITHFGNEGLYILCKNNMYNTIINIKGIATKHFNIIDRHRSRIIDCIINNNNYKILYTIPNFDSKYFQNNYEKTGGTGLYYLCKNNKVKFLDTIVNFKVEHFKNKYKVIGYYDKEFIGDYDKTELYWLCHNNLHNIILQIQNLTIHHFTMLEFEELCKNKMHRTIIQIDGLDIDYIINNNKIFDILQKYNMQDTINYILTNGIKNSFKCSKYFINNNIPKNSYLLLLCKYNAQDIVNKIESLQINHFQIKDNLGITCLHYLCKNNMHNTIIKLKGLEIKHFLIKDNNGYTGLHFICENNNMDTFKYLIDKLNLEAKHFLIKDNNECTGLQILKNKNRIDIIAMIL